MNIFDTALPDVKIIEPEAHGDERGFFMETFRDNWFREHIGHHTFVQENHSRSEHGVLRGLHYQTVCPQGKLVRVVSGSVFDVAVDLRRSSPTFGHWVGAVLSALCSGTTPPWASTGRWPPRRCFPAKMPPAACWHKPYCSIKGYLKP